MAIKHEGLTYLTTAEASKRLGISAHTVRRWINNRTVPAVYDGFRWYVSEPGAYLRRDTHPNRLVRKDARIRSLQARSAGQAEAAFREAYPEASWSDFARKFGGTPSRARHRFAKVSTS